MKGLHGADVPFMTRRAKEPAGERADERAGQPAAGRPGAERGPAQPLNPSRAEPARDPLDLTPRPAAERGRNPLDLSDGRPSPAPGAVRPSAPAQPQTPESRLYPAPAFGALHQLTAGDAVVRLNPRQSGIGSLFVTGARGTAWEGEDRTTGAQSVHREQIGTLIPTPGNRPLVGFVNRDAVVVLRHVRRLRRALFIGAGGTMTVQTFDGSAIAVQGTLGPGQRTVLTATRIGALLELRAESVPEEWDDGEIWREFAFTMTVGLGGPRR